MLVVPVSPIESQGLAAILGLQKAATRWFDAGEAGRRPEGAFVNGVQFHRGRALAAPTARQVGE